MTTPERIDEPSCYRSGKNPSGTANIVAKRLLKAATTAKDTVAVASATTDIPAGVSTETIYGGASASYQVSGRAVVTSGAAVAIGDQITTDANAKAIPATQSPGATQRVWGRAVTSASGADEDIEIELQSVGMVYNSVVSVATKAAMTAIAATNRFNGMLVMVQADRSLWWFDDDLAVSDTTKELLAAPDAGTGRWVRADKSFVMKLAFTYETADNANLFTVPEGFCLRLAGFPYWEIDVAMTGGSSSAIGISTDVTGYDTSGDLLGGASGDVAATLTAGIAAGTLGGELDDHVGFQALLLEEGQHIQFDRITSAFTAGSGKACIPVVVAVAPATP